MAVTVNYVKGENIIQEGVEGDRTFKILEGNVLVYKETPQKTFIPLAKLGPDDIFGEMYLTKDGYKRTASVLALCDVELLVYFHEDVAQVMEEMNPFLKSVLDTMGKRLDGVTSELVITIAENEGQEYSFHHLKKL